MLSSANSKQIFPLLLIAAIILYLPAYSYGMVTDFLSWILKYQSGSWSDVPSSFGYNGLHPVFHFFNFGLFKMAGLNKFIWSIAFALLHGINACLVFIVADRSLSNFNIDNAHNIALIASICFLLCPYQVEVVSWKACLHYLLATGFILLAYYYLLLHFVSPSNKKYVIIHHIFFVLALFTLEIALLAPFIFLLYFLFHGTIAFVNFRRHFKIFLLPHMLFLIGYFLLNKLILGGWIGHYGAETHLSVSIGGLFSHAYSYFFKYLFLVHSWNFNVREIIYTVLQNNGVLIVLLGISLLGLGVFLLNIKKSNRLLLYSALHILMFFLALAPILSLYFMYHVPYQNDRYGYFAAAFFYPALISLFFLLKPALRYLIIAVYLLLMLFLTLTSVAECRSAAKILDGLVDTFEYCSDKHVVLLALPDNYRGKYLYRDLSDEDAITFKESLNLFGTADCEDVQLIDIAQYNQQNLADDFVVNKIDSIHTSVKFGQFGNWFWKDGIGFHSYENQSFEVSIEEDKLLAKDKKPGEPKIFLIPNGPRWIKAF